jgi:hypothetical protein
MQQYRQGKAITLRLLALPPVRGLDLLDQQALS